MPATATAPKVRPLISREEMDRIVSSLPSRTSEQVYAQIEEHLGRPLLPARKKVFQNGQPVWICC